GGVVGGGFAAGGPGGGGGGCPVAGWGRLGAPALPGRTGAAGPGLCAATAAALRVAVRQGPHDPAVHVRGGRPLLGEQRAPRQEPVRRSPVRRRAGVAPDL